MPKKKRMKQATTTGPMSVKGGGKAGRKASFGHNMGDVFLAGPKKPEPDAKPRTRAAEGRSRQARMQRLDGKLI